MSGEGEEPRTAGDMPLPGGEFRMFVTRLSIQGMLSLGMLENPLNGQRTVQLPHARMLIDDLAMLLVKTEGNLDDDERAHLKKIVSDLEAHYARAASEESSEAEA